MNSSENEETSCDVLFPAWGEFKLIDHKDLTVYPQKQSIPFSVSSFKGQLKLKPPESCFQSTLSDMNRWTKYWKRLWVWIYMFDVCVRISWCWFSQRRYECWVISWHHHSLLISLTSLRHKHAVCSVIGWSGVLRLLVDSVFSKNSVGGVGGVGWGKGAGLKSLLAWLVYFTSVTDLKSVKRRWETENKNWQCSCCFLSAGDSEPPNETSAKDLNYNLSDTSYW